MSDDTNPDVETIKRLCEIISEQGRTIEALRAQLAVLASEAKR